MTRKPAFFVAGLLFVAAAATEPATERVQVSFDHPEKFLDSGARSHRRPGPDEPPLSTLAEYLRELGRRLPEGQTLSVTILDLDLAGEIKLTRMSGEELRVMRDGTWPRIKLRYVLSQNGGVLREGQEELADMNYLQRGGRSFSDPLRYEKRLLEEWFQRSVLGGRG